LPLALIVRRHRLFEFTLQPKCTRDTELVGAMSTSAPLPNRVVLLIA
jgi:hypothetical protein